MNYSHKLQRTIERDTIVVGSDEISLQDLLADMEDAERTPIRARLSACIEAKLTGDAVLMNELQPRLKEALRRGMSSLGYQQNTAQWAEEMAGKINGAIALAIQSGGKHPDPINPQKESPMSDAPFSNGLVSRMPQLIDAAEDLGQIPLNIGNSGIERLHDLHDMMGAEKYQSLLGAITGLIKGYESELRSGAVSPEPPSMDHIKKFIAAAPKVMQVLPEKGLDLLVESLNKAIMQRGQGGKNNERTWAKSVTPSGNPFVDAFPTRK